MFIELGSPIVTDIYRTKDRSKLRVAETGAPGRLWLCLTYKNDEEIKQFAENILAELAKPKKSE